MPRRSRRYVRRAPHIFRGRRTQLTRVFYRLLTSDPPSLDDFKSYHELGKVPPAGMEDDEEFLHRWRGLSVFDSLEAAESMAVAAYRRRKRRRWTHVAVLEIREDVPIIYEGPEDYGHWNLYEADPVFLKEECVARIVPLYPESDVSPDD